MELHVDRLTLGDEFTTQNPMNVKNNIEHAPGLARHLPSGFESETQLSSPVMILHKKFRSV